MCRCQIYPVKIANLKIGMCNAQSIALNLWQCPTLRRPVFSSHVVILQHAVESAIEIDGNDQPYLLLPWRDSKVNRFVNMNG